MPFKANRGFNPFPGRQRIGWRRKQMSGVFKNLSLLMKKVELSQSARKQGESYGDSGAFSITSLGTFDEKVEEQGNVPNFGGVSAPFEETPDSIKIDGTKILTVAPDPIEIDEVRSVAEESFDHNKPGTEEIFARSNESTSSMDDIQEHIETPFDYNIPVRNLLEAIIAEWEGRKN